jgi:hypothetical protein
MTDEKPKSELAPKVEEKPAVSVAPVEADAEKRESNIIDITDEFVRSGFSLIFTGVEKPQRR